EDQLAIVDRGLAPREVRRARRRRLIAVVCAQERGIEGVAWIREVVGVATEEARLQLRRPHELHRLEAVVLIELVLAAMEERDDLAFVVTRTLAFAFYSFHLCFDRLRHRGRA